MALQQPIAESFNRTLVGRTLDVLIDGPAPGGKSQWLGRTYADAPDVDGITLVTAAGVGSGDLVSCQITGAMGSDLYARPVAATGLVPPRQSASHERRARPKPRRKPPGALSILDGTP